MAFQTNEAAIKAMMLKGIFEPKNIINIKGIMTFKTPFSDTRYCIHDGEIINMETFKQQIRMECIERSEWLDNKQYKTQILNNYEA